MENESKADSTIAHSVQDKYPNLAELPDDSIEEILLDLEKTLREIDHENQAQKESVDDAEEQNLRECALKTMSSIVDKNNEDLIECSLNEAERQSVESQCPAKMTQRFPVVSTSNDAGSFPSTSSIKDAINKIAVPGNMIPATVYNRVASINPMFSQQPATSRVTLPNLQDDQFSMSSISDNELTPQTPKMMKVKKRTSSNNYRSVVQYNEKLQICTSYETEETIIKRHRRSRSRRRRSSSLESRRSRRQSSEERRLRFRKRSHSRDSFKSRRRLTRRRSPSEDPGFTPRLKICRYRSRSRSKENLRYRRESSSLERRYKYCRSPPRYSKRERQFRKSSSRDSLTRIRHRRNKYKHSRESSEESITRKRRRHNSSPEVDLRKVLNYYKSKRVAQEQERPKDTDQTGKRLSLFENYWNKSVLHRIGMPGTRSNKETMTDEVVISEKKDPPVDKECQTDDTLFTDTGAQTLPCIIYQAVEDVIEIPSDDDVDGESETQQQNTEIALAIPTSIGEEGTVILKLTFEAILVEDKSSYYPNHQKFLEYLEDVRSIAPFFQASFFNNYLYIWTTKYFGQWIMQFLSTFKYQPNKIISIEYSESPPESTEYKQIKAQLPKTVLNTNLIQSRWIFMKILMNGHTKEYYKSVIQKIRNLTTVNEDFKNILQERNIIYSNNMIKIIAKTSMDHTKRLKDLLNSFHSDTLLLNIFDHYVKLKVTGVTYETTIEQLEKVLNSCLQKTCLQIANWFVAEYEARSIFVYVPRKDADFIKTNSKFLLKGKYIIKFDFVDQKS